MSVEVQFDTVYEVESSRKGVPTRDREGLPTIEVVGGHADLYASNNTERPTDTSSMNLTDVSVEPGIHAVLGRVKWVAFVSQGASNIYSEGLVDHTEIS